MFTTCGKMGNLGVENQQWVISLDPQSLKMHHILA